MLPESHMVNGAVTWNEGYRSYPGYHSIMIITCWLWLDGIQIEILNQLVIIITASVDIFSIESVP